MSFPKHPPGTQSTRTTHRLNGDGGSGITQSTVYSYNSPGIFVTCINTLSGMAFTYLLSTLPPPIYPPEKNINTFEPSDFRPPNPRACSLQLSPPVQPPASARRRKPVGLQKRVRRWCYTTCSTYARRSWKSWLLNTTTTVSGQTIEHAPTYPALHSKEPLNRDVGIHPASVQLC